MQTVSSISVIIPSSHDRHDLLRVVRAVCDQTYIPTEIVIVDSSELCDDCPTEITILCLDKGINLNYRHLDRALPGDARNIGREMASCELIAFIDVQTIPRPRWLESSLLSIANHDASGVWGATCFSANSEFERLVRDGIYGALPRRTLPGSVFSRDVFDKAGQFISWVRAGEDTEWILRIEVLKIQVCDSKSPLIDYEGLIGSGAIKLLRKWYRNYTSCRVLPHFFPQRLLLWVVLYPCIVLVAFNWNYLIADWRLDSPLYLGHVTKIVATLPILIYLLVRGIVIPMRRGICLKSLLPVRFIAITLICLVADTVKILVFSYPQRKVDKRLDW